VADFKRLTTREMQAKGYALYSTSHPGTPSVCKKCGAEIEWWKSPNGKSIPYDLTQWDNQERACHFETCKGAPAPGNAAPPAPGAAASTGLFPSAQADAVAELKRQIVAEYKFEHQGDDLYGDREHKLNWLYKKLVQARLALRDCGLIQ
jgi:hypothetical protein